MDRPLRLGVDEASALLVGLRTLAEVAHAAADTGPADRSALSRTIAKLEGAAGEAGVPGRAEAAERDGDPMRLLIVEGRTYREGWCRRAEAVRLFRLDRVLGIEVL